MRPPGMIEGKRSINAKSFSGPDGKRRIEASIGPIHHRKAGQLLDYDLTPQDRAEDVLVNGAPFAVTVHKSRVEYTYVDESGAGARVTFLGVRPGAPARVGSVFTWANAALDTDITLRVGWKGVEAVAILKSATTPAVEYTVEEAGKDLLPPEARDARRHLVELDVVRTPIPGGYRERITLTGRVAEKRLRRGPPVWADSGIVYPVTLDPSISQDISDNADDGSEYAGVWYDDAYSGGNLYSGTYGGEHEHGGVRWRALAIDRLTIDDANITVELTALVGSPDIDVYGDDVDDAALWSEPSSVPSSITQTTAKTDWAPSGTGTEVIDVTAIVQEILDRGGWASGQDMRFGFINQHALSGQHDVTWDDLSGAGSPTVAQLNINWTVAAGVEIFRRRVEGY